ncbi:MAG: acetyltransferase [Patescibacteria group bacterium]|nr:acetyltransferase [Patescibacteria group bacterium]
MNFTVRTYRPADYDQLAALYRRTDTYGGVFSEERDSAARLRKRVEADPDAILVAERAGRIIGTVSLIEDGRVAWLFRFCVPATDDEAKVARALSDAALAALRSKGHHEVLVYTSTSDSKLHDRYEALGFTRGSDYACFWKELG